MFTFFYENSHSLLFLSGDMREAWKIAAVNGPGMLGKGTC
jgi:hypothetical protein